MKKKLLLSLPVELPTELEGLLSGGKIYDSSCSPEARVYFIDKDDGYYLKRAERGALFKEAQMTKYFYSIGLGAKVLYYISGKYDLLLTARMRGEDCTHKRYLDNPLWLCDTIADALRRLHEHNTDGCPIANRTADYITAVEENYSAGRYDMSLFSDRIVFGSPDEAIRVFRDGADALMSDTLLHGDYCLPNIMLDGNRLSGFIDVGNGGVGDRHIDIFWGIWTLWYNLKTDKYSSRFLDVYGRDKADKELLRVIAAAEIFG